MYLAHFRVLTHEWLNKDPDKVLEEDLLIILDSKSAAYTANNGKDTNNTRHIFRRVHLVRNGEKYTIFTGVKEVCNWHTLQLILPGRMA